MTTATKTNWGGTRTGAGRKKKPDTVVVSVRVRTAWQEPIRRAIQETIEKLRVPRKEMTKEEIEASIDRGLKQADEGKGIPSEEMWKEMRQW